MGALLGVGIFSKGMRHATSDERDGREIHHLAVPRAGPRDGRRRDRRRSPHQSLLTARPFRRPSQYDGYVDAPMRPDQGAALAAARRGARGDGQPRGRTPRRELCRLPGVRRAEPVGRSPASGCVVRAPSPAGRDLAGARRQVHATRGRRALLRSRRPSWSRVGAWAVGTTANQRRAGRPGRSGRRCAGHRVRRRAPRASRSTRSVPVSCGSCRRASTPHSVKPARPASDF